MTQDPQNHDSKSGPSGPQAEAKSRISRRAMMIGAGLSVGAAAGVGGRWLWTSHENGLRSAVVVTKATAYDDRLADIIKDGLNELGVDRDRIKGKSVLLKPNLVEPSLDSPHINTHPLFVRAAAEVFRRLDAREVLIAEGQGHIRDTYLVLEQSGLEPILKEAALPFIDLNHDDIFPRENLYRATNMKTLYLPRTLKRADLVVSLPKMKTHHWAGVTLSMKNLYGMMPGIYYGWPKNVLHQAGIPKAIVDINSTVAPDLAIIDGIVGMEGDGPIMGTPKQSNMIVMGTNLPAVDATAARLMDFDPWRIEFLWRSSGRLGPIGASNIEQRGEPLVVMKTRFEYPDHPHFKQFRS